MHTVVSRLIIIFTAVSVLCSCAPAGGAQLRMTESGYTTETTEIKTQGFEISGIDNESFCGEVNTSVARDIDGAVVSFETMAQEAGDNIRMGNRCILNITQEVRCNENDILSVIEEHYVYTGGAHGSYMRYPRNYDLLQRKQIHLSDMFNEGYVETLNRMIREREEADTERYSELWDKPEIRPEHETNFYINRDALVIFFQPYELSYYAKGYIEFELPFSELSGAMKEEYRRLCL